MTHFFIADDAILKTEFTIDGVAQTPLSGTVKIVDEDNNITVAAGTPVSGIVDTVASYNFLNAAVGNYAILWTLDFGTAKVTRGFYFRVDEKLYENVD